MDKLMTKRHPISFTDAQNTIITRSLTSVSLLLFIIVSGGTLWLVIQGLNGLIHVIGPVIVAFFLALLTKPIYDFYVNIFKQRRAISMIAFLLTFAIPIVLICFFAGDLLIRQGQLLYRNLPIIFERIRDFLITTFPAAKSTIVEFIPDMKLYFSVDGSFDWGSVSGILTKSLSYGGVFSGALLSAGSVVVMWIVLPIYWILFVSQPVSSSVDLVHQLPFLSEQTKLSLGRQASLFQELLVSYFRGQFIDVTIQGILYGTAFALIGLPGGFLIGLFMGYMNLLPYIGSTIALIVALPVAFFSCGLYDTVLTLIAFACIQTLDGYVIQPWIQGDRMQLKTWQIIFAILFWSQASGFIGLLIAIPLTAFLRSVWEGFLSYSQQFTAQTTPKSNEVIS